MNNTGIPYLDFAWNPGGCGCSNGCPTCWAGGKVAQRVGTNIGCDDCAAFRVHWHPERLSGKAAPAARRKAAVVGVQFTGDLFDPKRSLNEISAALDAMLAAPQHTYVLLTQQYELAAAVLNGWYARAREAHAEAAAATSRWRIGTTCRCQAEYDRAANALGGTRWNWWVSAEPLAASIAPGAARRPGGIIIGADNRLAADCGIAPIRQTAKAFFAADVPIFVKQMWGLRCRRCEARHELRDWPDNICACGTPLCEMGWRLATLPHEFPSNLRLRSLPWTLTTKL